MPKPTRFLIEYVTDADVTVTRSARSLDHARKMAARWAPFFGHVGIYERRNIEQIEPPYGPWFFDTEWVEDGPS